MWGIFKILGSLLLAAHGLVSDGYCSGWLYVYSSPERFTAHFRHDIRTGCVKTAYVYKNISVISCLDGESVTLFQDGSKLFSFPDKSLRWEYPDRSKRLEFPEGGSVEIYPYNEKEDIPFHRIVRHEGIYLRITNEDELMQVELDGTIYKASITDEGRIFGNVLPSERSFQFVEFTREYLKNTQFWVLKLKPDPS